MAALDLLGRRWSLRVLWELRDGPLGFRELQQRCDRMSSSVLRQRLVELEDAGLVRHTTDGLNELSALGHDLGSAIQPLTSWSIRWRRSLEQ
jgi:DNA-binding HxlR family transcriptional regulator